MKIRWEYQGQIEEKKVKENTDDQIELPIGDIEADDDNNLDDLQEDEPSQITDVIKELGLGASLYLMMTKALTIFFLTMFILQLPILICYWSNPSADYS